MKIQKLKVKSIIGRKTGHTRQAVVMDAWIKSREIHNKLLQK